MHNRTLACVAIAMFMIAGCSGPGRQPAGSAGTADGSPRATAAGTRESTASITDPHAVTTGVAQTSHPASPTTQCNDPRTQFTAANNGTVYAADGTQWIVPAPVTDGPVATDLYNNCTGAGDNSANYAAQLKTIVIDPDGVELTAFIFADNYYELFVNGVFVARDPIAFTPFNSTVVRFKAKYPITYAVKLVDWEEHLGVGMEYDRYNVGDGGFIAKFSDGTVTSADWKAQPYYSAPLDDPSCVNERDTAACSVKPACVDQPDSCMALHFNLPEQWAAPAYDDTGWTPATVYQARDVTNSEAYVNYIDYFEPASFIWSRNLKIDNLVLARYTVQVPPK
jgi:hypothetical protein